MPRWERLETTGALNQEKHQSKETTERGEQRQYSTTGHYPQTQRNMPIGTCHWSNLPGLDHTDFITGEDMKVEKFSFHFELSPSSQYQKATVGLTVDCILEEGDDYLAELERVKKEVRREVANAALAAIDKLTELAANKGRDV